MSGHTLTPLQGWLMVLACLVAASFFLGFQVRATPRDDKKRRRWLYPLYYTLLVLAVSLLVFTYRYLNGEISRR